MKSIILSIIISSLVAAGTGYYFGAWAKESDIEFAYCSVYKVYTDGILYSLNGSDIESSPKTKSRLISELKTTYGEVERCLEMGIEIQGQLRATNGAANEYLQSL